MCWANLVDIEPRLVAVESRAATVSRLCGRRRGRVFWMGYESVKRDASKLVGWDAKRSEIATSRAYETAIGHLVDVCSGRVEPTGKKAHHAIAAGGRIHD